MDDYKQPYLYLFNRITDAIVLIRQSNYGMVRSVMIAAQQDAEEAVLQGSTNENASSHRNSEKPML